MVRVGMVRVEVPIADAEVAADLLWAAGASAVEEAAAGDRDDRVVLTADLDDCPAEISDRWPCRVEDDDGAWWDGWRPYARAVRAGVFVVHPPWVAAEVEEGQVDLALDAGRSFGTGSHPSTVLVLDLLGRLVTSGCSVLDVGCGSGALAIGAALLGAGRVTAIDIDPEARAATADNAEANGVRLRIDLSDQGLDDVAESFDLVLANLGSPLVVDLAGPLAGRMSPGATLVVSGLLDDRWDHVPPAYPTLRLVDRVTLDGWCALVLE